MLTTVLTGVGIMISGTACQSANRQFTDRSSGQLLGSPVLGNYDVTNSLTSRFVGLVPALVFAAVFGE